MIDLQIVCDDVVVTNDGMIHLNEAMFSGAINLLNNPEEILLRIHPKKKAVFDSITDGSIHSIEVRDSASGKLVKQKINPQIKIHVNSPAGIVAVNYADIAHTPMKSLVRDFQVQGFDDNAEPIIRLIKDGSLRVIFCTMPPKKNILGNAFDMDHFARQLQKNVSSQFAWDDRDVFYFKSSEPSNVREITNFISKFGR
ncbi:hypothetical protein ACO0LF_05900 [Undibacterium sp. Di27W]|uniref:hypothetical protein n=1 Tax=Undibacterium sp. Di27W TaxID=3413036 RepID=UPI003BF08B13